MSTLSGIVPDPDRPLVLLLCDDLFVLPRLQDAVRLAGLQSIAIDHPSALGAQGDPAPRPIPITEPLEGSEARFLRAVVELQPALIVFDLSSASLPWERWIQVLSTSAATRRIPRVAFGPHVEAANLGRALQLGATRAMPRGAFLAALPAMLEEAARRSDPAAFEAGCREPLDDRAIEGLRLIERGDHFAAHERLEAAVLAAPGPEAALYRVLLQLAVAYLHIQRGNLRGARKMLLRLQGWLHPLPGACRGVDVSRLRVEIAELQAALDAAGEQPAAVSPSLLRPIPLVREQDDTA